VVNGVDLKNVWDIQGPNGKKCLAVGEADFSPVADAIDSISCDDSSSVIRLEYKIHEKAKYPKYQIFQKECQEYFEAGTEPIRGILAPDEDNRVALSLTPTSDGNDALTASLEILLTEVSLSSSLWRRLSNMEKEHQTIEFCVRMGLWLPPEAGNMEVNFRETNVSMKFNKQTSGEGNRYVFDSFVLNPKELVRISVNLGSTVKVKDEKEDPPEDSSGEERVEL
jgi:hypothetical protein